MHLPPVLNPQLNPTGYMAAAGAIYAAAVAVYNAVNHHTALSLPVVIAGIAAIAALFTRTVVTPVAAPKDGNGTPLVVARPVVVPPPGMTASTAVNNPPVPPTGTVTLLPKPTLGTTSEPPTSTPVA